MRKQKVSDGWKYMLNTATILGVLFAAYFTISKIREENFRENLRKVVIPLEHITHLNQYSSFSPTIHVRQKDGTTIIKYPCVDKRDKLQHFTEQQYIQQFGQQAFEKQFGGLEQKAIQQN